MKWRVTPVEMKAGSFRESGDISPVLKRKFSRFGLFLLQNLACDVSMERRKMNGMTTAAIPLLACSVTFGVIGTSTGDVTFSALALGMLAAGLPLLVSGLRRKHLNRNHDSR